MSFAFVNCKKLGSRGDIGAASIHARGLGKMCEARRRDEPDLTSRCLTINSSEKMHVHPIGSRSLDLSKDFEAHITSCGAALRKGAYTALHLIVGVSPDWVATAGDVHDPKNPRVQALLRETQAWGEKEFGGVWHCRYDVDEKGSGIVDLICSPVRQNKRSGKSFVSTTKALEELAQRHGKPPAQSFSAMQDSWHKHAQSTLDPTLERGEDSKKSGREHLSPEAYGRMKDRERELAKNEAELAERDALVAERQREALELADQAREQQRMAELRAVAAREREDDATELEREVAQREADALRHEEEAAERERIARELADQAREEQRMAREKELAAQKLDADARRREDDAADLEALTTKRERALKQRVSDFRKEAREVLLQVGKNINRAGAGIKASFLKLQKLAGETWHDRHTRIGKAAEFARSRGRILAERNRAIKRDCARNLAAARRNELERDAARRGVDDGARGPAEPNL